MHFASRDLGPHRFTPRRPPAFLPALKSALALETAKSGQLTTYRLSFNLFLEIFSRRCVTGSDEERGGKKFLGVSIADQAHEAVREHASPCETEI